MPDHFGTQGTLRVADQEYSIFRLPELQKRFPAVAGLPF